MIGIRDVIAALQQHWAAENPADAAVHFPGIPFDPTPLTAWYELWVTQADESPFRNSQSAALLLLVDVHCFSRDPNQHRVAALADAARQALAHRILPVTDWNQSETVAGCLRIRESATRDLSRGESDERRLPLQHIVVSLTARAEALESWPAA